MTIQSGTGIATRLREWLDALGDSLARVDLAAIVRAEAELVPLLADLASASSRGFDTGAGRAEVERARLAIARCRRLGAIFDRGDAGLAAAAYDDRGHARARQLPRGFTSKG